MRDTLTRDNWQDFQRRYVGTYGFYCDEGKRQLVQMGKTTEYSVVFTDVDGYAFSVNADSGVEFEFIPVDRGFYNTPDHTYLLYRVPARQWLRGISETNTVAMRFYSGELMQEEVGIKLLHKIFMKGVDVQQSFKTWKFSREYGGSHAVGLSKQFAIGDNRVYFYNKVIGKVKDNAITLDNSIVAQELQDVIRRNALDLEVSVNVS